LTNVPSATQPLHRPNYTSVGSGVVVDSVGQSRSHRKRHTTFVGSSSSSFYLSKGVLGTSWQTCVPLNVSIADAKVERLLPRGKILNVVGNERLKPYF